MKRPRRTLSDYLALAPWWISILIAGMAYVLLRYLLPPLFDDPGIEAPAAILIFFAPYIAALLLIPLPFALFHREDHKLLVETERQLELLRDLELDEFTRLLAEGYRREGYSIESAGGNGKFDLLLKRGGEKTIVVCKRWRARSVSAKWARMVRDVQLAYGAAGSHLVTCGQFSIGALRFARLSSTQLIDGRALLKLVREPSQRVAMADKDHYVPSPMMAMVPGTITNEPAPSGAPAASPLCPRCGSSMERHTGTEGISAGVEFWACERFPDCRGTRPA